MKTFPTDDHTAARRPLQVWSTVRDELQERRQAKREYRALASELASYTTRSEVDDLLATVHGQNDTDARSIREILAQNVLRRESRQRVS